MHRVAIDLTFIFSMLTFCLPLGHTEAFAEDGNSVYFVVHLYGRAALLTVLSVVYVPLSRSYL